MTRESILQGLAQCRSEDEWSRVCDRVKEYTKTLPLSERSGEYPEWWFRDVVMTGLYSAIRDNQ